MENSQSLQDEVCTHIRMGNFSRALQNCQEWLSLLPLEPSSALEHGDEEKPENEYRYASEAFFYCRFFLHRQERLAQIPMGADKARLFLSFFQEIKDMQKEKNFYNDSQVFYALSFFIHSQVADGLAKAFAGQKAFDLDQSEILQLARSLLFTENWVGALETLKFLQQHSNNRNPEVLLLLAFAHWQLENTIAFQENFREALFLKPEVLKDHLQLIPSGSFARLWENLGRQGYPPNLIYRYYALFAEVNGLYAPLRTLDNHEAEKLEDDFAKMQQLQNTNPAQGEEITPRLMHLLCRMLVHFSRSHEYEKVENYKNIFNGLDETMWQSFNENVLKALPKY